MVSDLTFESLIHFEFIFAYSVRKWSSGHFFTCLVFPKTFIKDCLFPMVYSCHLCHRLIDHISMCFFLGSLFCFIDLCVYFSASTILLWLLYLGSIVWNQEAWYLQLCSSFSRSCWLFRVFHSSVQILRLSVFILWKIPWVFW